MDIYIPGQPLMISSKILSGAFNHEFRLFILNRENWSLENSGTPAVVEDQKTRMIIINNQFIY